MFKVRFVFNFKSNNGIKTQKSINYSVFRVHKNIISKTYCYYSDYKISIKNI